MAAKVAVSGVDKIKTADKALAKVLESVGHTAITTGQHTSPARKLEGMPAILVNITPESGASVLLRTSTNIA